MCCVSLRLEPSDEGGWLRVDNSTNFQEIVRYETGWSRFASTAKFFAETSAEGVSTFRNRLLLEVLTRCLILADEDHMVYEQC